MDEKVIAPLNYIEPTSERPPEVWPPIADAANDLKELKKAVEDAASISSTLWLSYLFALFYFAVAAGAVTHEDLFFERSVRLPFLGIDLPLLAFFFLAPVIFVFIHIFTLAHFVMLAEKAKRFDCELRRQINIDPPEVGRASASMTRNMLRLQLPGNIFVQFLTGPEQTRERSFGLLLRLIAWATLVVGPILLLLLLELQFLPYHNALITWTQRLALMADLAMLWWLWHKILLGQGRPAYTNQSRGTPISIGICVILSCLTVVFACFIAIFPGELQEKVPSLRILSARTDSGEIKRISLQEFLFYQPVNNITRRRASFLSATLVLPGLNIYDGLKIDDPTKVSWRDFVFLARGRDLKGAIFDLAVLKKVDFAGAHLEAASLNEVQLQGATLENAKLQGASLNKAQLQDVSLAGAQLQNASFEEAHMRDAKLDGAIMEGAILSDTELQGASLGGAYAIGAVLRGAQLVGANLGYASLQGAYLADAKLTGASLVHAHLQGADLQDAEMEGVSLAQAQLQGASLAGAQLQGAFLAGADLEASDLSGAFLWRADGTPENARKVQIFDVVWTPYSDDFGNRAPWTNTTYEALSNEILLLSDKGKREAALRRVRRVECVKAQSDQQVASCDPKLAVPPDAQTLRHSLEESQTQSIASYRSALAASLQDLVCKESYASIQILSALLQNGRLKATGREGAGAVNLMLGNVAGGTCPGLRSLPDNEKDRLTRIAVKFSPSP